MAGPPQQAAWLAGEERDSRARICKPFKEPWNRFPAWRAGTKTLFDVHCKKCRRTFRCPREKYLPNVEQIQ
jgi:hypothetical protein